MGLTLISAVGNILQFRFNVGNGIQTLEKMTAYPLNDDNWHTVLVERNRKQARLRIDLQAHITLDEPTDQEFRPLILDSPLVLGKVDYPKRGLALFRFFEPTDQEFKPLILDSQFLLGNLHIYVFFLFTNLN